MATDPNTYELLVFDPGGTIGWARFEIDAHAFSRPDNKVFNHIRDWDYGELDDKDETTNIAHAVGMIYAMSVGTMPYNCSIDFVSEDFILTQQIGGRNLLSPVRINAVLDWECRKQGQLLQYQARQMRTLVTKDWLVRRGLKKPRMRKDEFAAMQHAVTWLKRRKLAANARPWKLAAHGHHNAVWDCSCAQGFTTCDMAHPK